MSKLCVYLLLPVLSDPVFSIIFYLPVNSRKCLQEDVNQNVLVTGDYEISAVPKTTTNLQITDSFGHMLYTKENATKGKFSFTTENHNQFNICFHSRSPMGTRRIPDQLVKLNTKHGTEAKNYEEIEKEEKLTPLEARLRHLEYLSHSIADNLRKRWKEMRDTNGSTNTRVLLFSIISMCCLTALATWQVFYLKRFFKAKKLID
ncbi:transmembrane emp24 domain-containing protein 10 [Lates japonicus]|uniref:Transmembrane emp24 domain-containing protein 10 n=1 Tax=Lates japonicus TaxID=270547 RepID=A0AAD3MYD0_LATJO|nr:transmembrane emp24 domain-containing protein 10 [Lates japonicus]